MRGWVVRRCVICQDCLNLIGAKWRGFFHAPLDHFISVPILRLKSRDRSEGQMYTRIPIQYLAQPADGWAGDSILSTPAPEPLSTRGGRRIPIVSPARNAQRNNKVVGNNRQDRTNGQSATAAFDKESAAEKNAKPQPPRVEEATGESAVIKSHEEEGATSEAEQLKAALEKAQASEAQLVQDFRNYRRHAEADLKASKTKAEVELLASLAETVQALESAGNSVETDPGAVREGVLLIARNLKKVFDAHGLKRIQTTGEAFDPNEHEAVLAEEADGVEKGMIVREVSPGFRTDKEVIRPARVSVAA